MDFRYYWSKIKEKKSVNVCSKKEFFMIINPGTWTPVDLAVI